MLVADNTIDNLLLSAFGTRRSLMVEKNTSEYDYSGEGSPKQVLTKSGPAGLLVIYYLAVAAIAIIGLLVWRLLT